MRAPVSWLTVPSAHEVEIGLPDAHGPAFMMVPSLLPTLKRFTALAATPYVDSPAVPALTEAGQAALDAARALGRNAAAPATLRAYKADWTHYAAWCIAKGSTPVPAAPATVGAYLASLGDSHAPTTILRRLAALGKVHRFNDLPWNPGRRLITASPKFQHISCPAANRVSRR